MGGGKHGGYKNAAQRRAVHASKADGGKGNPNKMVSPLGFGAGGASIAGIPSGMFGSLGANPSINSLTNANAMAAQEAAARQINRGAQAAVQPMGSGIVFDNVEDNTFARGRFNPSAQNVAMGMFGDIAGRSRSLLGGQGMGNPFMMHDEEKIKRLEAEISDIQANGENSKFVNEGEDPQDAAFRRQSDIMDEKKKHKKDNEGSPAKRGETYEEFKKRTGKTGMKAYMRENPKGSK